jgi:phytoene dehydrogenase-like protein
MDTKHVVIIGGGVAGLVAAYHLEEAGLIPTIVEATDRVGGRVKTDVVDGFQLDHGFQVLLTAYREAKRYLDYDDLQLKHFRPGAVVMKSGKSLPIVDPLREPSQLLKAALSPVGTLKDKYLIWRFGQMLKAKSVEELFTEQRQETTMNFLQSYGFSQGFIQSFFQPFFGGIFLENELQTPAPMLKFVFKMFAEGYAALPKTGMEAIPKQLVGKLSKTKILLNSVAQSLENNQVRLANGESIPFDYLIVATAPDQLLPQLAGSKLSYNSTATFYYRSTESLLPKGLIALVNEANSMVNNFCEPSTVVEAYAPSQSHLLSVTLKDIPTQANAEEKVAAELRRLTSHPQWQLSPIGQYNLPQALPRLEHLAYDYSSTQSRLTEQIFLAGDQLLFGSLDAAMRSGRRAAEGILDRL